MARTSPLSRGRRIAIWSLISLASLLAIVAILATWVNRQILDNGSFEQTSTRLVRDPAIQSALSTYLVNEAYDNVDIPAAIAERLPPNLKPLAAPLAAAVRQPATSAVNRLLNRPRVQSLFVNATTGTHKQLVAVVEDKTGAATSTANGNVTLDLGALVQQIGPSLGLPAAALDRVPPNTGVITVMRSDQLGLVQNGVKAVRIVSTWFVVLILALFAAAIYLAAGARRETLRTVGWAFVFVGLLVLAVRRFAGSYTVDALAAPAYRDAVNHAWLISSSILGEVGRAIVLYGLVAVLGAILAGPSRVAVATRQPAGADPQRAGRHHVGRRRILLPPARALGRHPRASHLVGDPAPRRADRTGNRRAPPADPARVPGTDAEARRRCDVGRCTSRSGLATEAGGRSGADAGRRARSPGCAARQRRIDRR